MLDQEPTGTPLALAELVELCAADSELFCKTFFPKAFRQPAPSFAPRFWDLLDDPRIRYGNGQMFRGSSKTTRSRAYAAKRIAYGLSRTILYIGKSEGHAVRSIKWLQQQVLFNPLFASTFQLERGNTWTGTECQIHHGIEGHSVWIMGMGITGSIRGINQEDFRPDLIVIDDVCDEENSATAEQREKIDDLVFGALVESLAPASETPDAKMIILATPLNRDDVSTRALKDPMFKSIVVGCWTPETAELPIDQQESIWPERWSSETLRAEKRAAMARNKLSLFVREKECKITSRETSVFKPEWLKRWTTLPPTMSHLLAIDPVPPPSNIAIAKGFTTKDYEALAMVGVASGAFYVREVLVNRGHDPSWTIAQTFYLAAKYRPTKWLLEGVAYQRTLKWILGEAMKNAKRWWYIEAFVDQRSKYNRIVDGLNGPASNGQLYIPPDDHPQGINNSEGMAMFVEQFNNYINTSHDDALESVAVGVSGLTGVLTGLDDETGPEDEEGAEWKPLQRARELMAP